MPLPIQAILTKFIDFIPGLRRSPDKMTTLPEFKATDNLSHRYSDQNVLREYLINVLKFNKDEIRIQATQELGLQVQLNRDLTNKERSDIFRHFKEVKLRNRASSSQEKEGDHD
ncbi:hypothetical protein F5Y16DRAFT_393442 [Xylariaceae sp. FL0255]|nr:hypothetical protein F5Y16DRAFT_393442 [Xylariaceae sp. FL0255]